MTEDPIAAARADGRHTLTEAEGKRLLSDAGLDTPSFAVCATVDEAVEAGADIGYPVVVKVSSPSVTHKSEWAGGVGVAVGVKSGDDVRAATERIFEAASERDIDAEVLVETAVDLDAGTEILVGGVRDPSFGPVVVTGLGGVFSEVFSDTSHRIAPVSHVEARAALEELQVADLLAGYRGRHAADVDALADVVVTVGNLVTDHPIAELDLNPVLASPDGAVALDALVVLEELTAPETATPAETAGEDR